MSQSKEVATSAGDEGARGEASRSALRRRILPVAGLVAAGLVAAGYFLGFLGDRAVAAIVALAFVAVQVVIAVGKGFKRASSRTRAAVAGYAALMAVVGFFPAYEELVPGEPAAIGELGEEQRTLALSSGGAYRFVVSSPLAGSREERVSYRLKVGREVVDGVLERVTTAQRAQRGGAAPVADALYVSTRKLTVPSDAARVELDSVAGGASGAQLTVRAYKVLPPWITYAVAALMLAVGIYLEIRLSADGALSMTGASAVLFGVLFRTAHPLTVLVLALIAAGAGDLLGSALGSIGRELFAPKAGAPEAARRLAAQDAPEMRIKVRVIGRIDLANAIAEALRGAGVDAEVVTAGPMTVFNAAPPPDGGADIVVATSLFDPPLWRLAKARSPLRPIVAVAEPRRERFLRALVTRRHGPDAYVTWPTSAAELTAAVQRASASAGQLRRWSWLDVGAAAVPLCTFAFYFPVGRGVWADAAKASAVLLAGAGLLVGAPFAWSARWQAFTGLLVAGFGIAMLVALAAS